MPPNDNANSGTSISGQTGQVSMQGFFGLPCYADAGFLHRLNGRTRKPGSRQSPAYYSSTAGSAETRSGIRPNQILVRFNNTVRNDKDMVMKGFTSLNGMTGEEAGIGNLKLIEQRLQELGWQPDVIDSILTETIANQLHFVGIAREDVPYSDKMRWNQRSFAAQRSGRSPVLNLSGEVIHQGNRLETFVLSATALNSLDYNQLKRYNEIVQGQALVGVREARDSTYVAYLNNIMALYVHNPEIYFDLHGPNSLINNGTTYAVHVTETMRKVDGLLMMYAVLKGLGLAVVPISQLDERRHLLTDSLSEERQPHPFMDFYDSTANQPAGNVIDNFKKSKVFKNRYLLEIQDNAPYANLRRNMYACKEGPGVYRTARNGDELEKVTFMGDPETFISWLAQMMSVLPDSNPGHEQNNIFGSLYTLERQRAADDPTVYDEISMALDFEDWVVKVMHGASMAPGDGTQFEFGDVAIMDPDAGSIYLRNVAQINDGLSTVPNPNNNAGRFLMLQHEHISAINLASSQIRSIRDARNCGWAAGSVEPGHVTSMWIEGVGAPVTGA